MVPTLKRLAPVLLGSALLLVLILYMGGVFRTGRIGPEDARAPALQAPAEGTRVAARRVERPSVHEAVGTVQAVSAARIEAQVRAAVRAVGVRSGDPVVVGQLLVELDDRELRARHAQAGEALNAARQQQVQAERQIEAAQAHHVRAQAEHARVRTFLAAEAATLREMEGVEADLRQAEAQLARSRAALAEARALVEQARRRLEEAAVHLGHARILSPVDGQVVERRVDPGDLAAPGKTLLVVRGEGALRLEALVPEGLIGRLSLGQELAVEVAGQEIVGVVDEMVPAADPAARAFLVKIALKSASGLYPGMFGRARLPLDPRPVVLVPFAAVRRIGQLEMVRVVEDEQVKTLLVTTGSRVGEDIEVLSGLRGEEILLIEGARP